MKNKNILALCLSAAMFGTILSGCGGGTTDSGTSTTGSTQSGESQSGKTEKVVMALMSFNKIPDDYSRITEAINKLTKAKANVELDMKLYGPADYTQKLNLALASGEQMDIFMPPMTESIGSLVAKSSILPLDDLFKKYGKETEDILNKDFGEGLLKSTTLDGHIYGIPANKGMSVPMSIVYNADMLKETGFTEKDINSLNDMPKIFDAVKKKFPDVVPFGPINVNPSDSGLLRYLEGTGEVDMLTDNSGVGVVLGNSGKVVNLYDTDLFKNGVKIMRDWYKKGYIQKDAATTTTNQPQLLSSGRGFAYLGGYSGKEIGKTLSMQYGKNIAAKRVAPFYFDTLATTFVTWVVNSNTEVPDAAMKMLNLTYTDKDVLNTILWGVEGQDYIKVDEHHAKYPDGKTADTVGYTAQLTSGILGSESLQLQPNGVSFEDISFKLSENKSTKRSPYLGFIFDPKDVKTEMSAVTNVNNQYLPGLVCGSLDPDTTLPKYIKALNDAGAQTIMQKKQEQLDKWLSANK
jgi:putative aldouronate transport system substrate-binding protein